MGSAISTALRWLRKHAIIIIGLLIIAYIMLPNIVVIIFSFNQPVGRRNGIWHEFSFNAWTHICAPAGMCDAVGLSLGIGVVAALVATVIGTMAAFALVRYRFRGRGTTNLLVFFPMATPEVVMGSSLLTLFIAVGVRSGIATILIAHILFTLSFVVTTVKARVASMDPALEQAAADLYATPSQAFWRVPSRWPLRESLRVPCWPLRSASTTTSSRASTPGLRRSRSRCTSGALPRRVCRCR